MGEDNPNMQEMGFNESRQIHWAAIKKDDHTYCESINDLSSLSSSSSFSSSSSSSSELADDASSSSSTSSTSSGPLYELADLMAQLPIKKGLSKFYNGKSQTFASLANLRSVEDLGKKESYSRRMKSSKSCEENLDHHKFGPKATMTKKRPPKRLFSTSFATTKGAMIVYR